MINHTHRFHLFRFIIFLFFLFVQNSKTNKKSMVSGLLDKEIDFSFNLTHVLWQAVLFCGTEIVCNKSLLNFVNGPFNITTKSWCPKCFCSDECLSDASIPCCPEIFFNKRFVQCQSLSILPYENDALFPVISSCPPGSSLQSRINCQRSQSDLERLKNPPVTGTISKMNFRNEFCAICNNETRYERWNSIWRCERDLDINYITHLEDIVKIARNNECGISFHHYLFSNINCTEHEEQISTCNSTGNWRTYDIQIEKSCHSTYNVSFGVFKNIFCAICNPPDKTNEVWIDNCQYSNVYKNACLYQPKVESSFPYKNYFCFACNRNNNNPDFFYDVDLLSNVDTYKQKTKQFQFVIEFQYRNRDLQRFLNQFDSKSENLTTISETLEYPPLVDSLANEHMIYLGTKRHGCLKADKYGYLWGTVPTEYESSEVTAINVTNLVRISFAMTQNAVCRKRRLPPYTLSIQKTCSCSFGCTSQCCEDHAFLQSWTCINEVYPELDNEKYKEKEYLAMNGCVFSNDYQRLCLNMSVFHYYRHIPVRVSSGYLESYVNVFCYLCVKKGEATYDSSTEDLLKDMRPWSLNVTCPNYVNYRHICSLEQLLNLFNQSSCTIAFNVPKGSMECRESCKYYIGSCNVTGTWKTFDKDIYTACEHTDVLTFMPINSKFKNIFCQICNPEVLDHSSLSIIDSCKANQEPNLVKACKEFPASFACENYKNIFCQECNDYGWGKCYDVNTHKVYSSGNYIQIQQEETYLTSQVFKVYEHFDDDELMSNSHCSVKQIYDGMHNICRNLSCLPGKQFSNGTCQSVLKITTKLRYTMALKITFTTLTNESVQETLMKCMQHVINTVNKTCRNPLIEDFLLLTYNTCQAVTPVKSELFLFSKFFVNNSVIRDDIENKLILLTEATATWNLSTDGMLVNVSISRSETALLLPFIVWKLAKKTHCFVQIQTRQVGPIIYKDSVISPLLTCQSLQIKGNEFGVDWTALLRIKHSYPGLTFSSPHFETFSDGELRVCAKDIPMYIENIKAMLFGTSSPSSSIFTISCLIISMFFLSVVMITYCYFPQQRTLYGVNNVVLSFFLFIAQGIRLLEQLCHPVNHLTWSVLQHFSWLATFFLQQSCSFYLYQLVDSQRVPTLTDLYVRKAVINCVVYAFSLSALFVAPNVILLFCLPNDLSYDRTPTLSYKPLFIATLMGPLGFVLVSNLICFLIVALRIDVNMTVNLENSKSILKQLSVFQKQLFLSFGFWLMQIIDTMVNVSSFSYIGDSLSFLQGLALFVSCINSDRVLNAYKSFCGFCIPIQKAQ